MPVDHHDHEPSSTPQDSDSDDEEDDDDNDDDDDDDDDLPDTDNDGIPDHLDPSGDMPAYSGSAIKIGASVGGLFGVAMIVVAVWFIRRHHLKKCAKAAEEAEKAAATAVNSRNPSRWASRVGSRVGSMSGESPILYPTAVRDKGKGRAVDVGVRRVGSNGSGSVEAGSCNGGGERDEERLVCPKSPRLEGRDPEEGRFGRL